MPTLYNLQTEINPNLGKKIPMNLYNESAAVYERTGLVGKLHVNDFGRVFQEFDDSCDVFVRGAFDVTYRGMIDVTAREVVELLRLKTSGFNDEGQRMIETGDFIVNKLEEVDPLAQILPWDVYSNRSMIPSMEIETPCGIQNVHIHTKTGEIIQFWKPEKDKFWYDRDTFKGYVLDVMMDLIPGEKLNLLARMQRDKKRKMIVSYSKTFEDPSFPDKIEL